MLELVELICGRHEGSPSARVRGHVARLGRRQGRIDRYCDGAERQNREIRQEPFGTALRHDHDAIARLDARRHQSERKIPHPVEPVAGGLARDAPVAALPD